jgi:hypothetical protein
VADLKKIPIGVAGFPRIRQKSYLYADKTELIRQFIENDTPYFLSRPRRFGKSLLVSTLKAVLQGGDDNRKLFEGLWIHDHSDYDWTPNPVIHLSLNSISADSVTSLNQDLLDTLKIIADKEKLSPIGASPAVFFSSLISMLSDK